MKKPLRYMLSVVLMLALMLSMGTAAFADNTDSKPPIEYVSYGIGLPDEPGVEKHGLGDNDITIDGVSWKPKTSDDKLYVHILDLAAAKLLRGCADEAKELGLDYAKLYIENGLIQVKEGIPSAEAAELKGKLDKLTYAAVIGVVAGDVFDVGNGGDVKLQVVVAGFVTGDGGASSPTAAQGTGKSGLDVKGIGMPIGDDGYYDLSGVNGENFAGVTNSTIYIIYGGVTQYGGADCNSLDSEPPSQEEIPGHRSGFSGVGVAKAAGDRNTYYVKVVGLGDKAEFIPVDDLAKLGDDPDAIWSAKIAEIIGNDYDNYGDLATEIIVATDQEGKDIVMKIKLIDDTAKLEELPDKKDPSPLAENPDENESAAPKESSGEGESNETPKYNEPKVVDEESGLLQYDPVDMVEEDHTPGEETAEVTVRDTILVYPQEEYPGGNPDLPDPK